MKSLLLLSPRFMLAAALLLLLLPPLTRFANAQTTAATPATAAPTTQTSSAISVPLEQTIQRIRTEDAGTRIDEVRVGGQTQSITVQPKVGLNTPAYEVKSADSAKGHAPSASNGDTNGARVWNLFKF